MGVLGAVELSGACVATVGLLHLLGLGFSSFGKESACKDV